MKHRHMSEERMPALCRIALKSEPTPHFGTIIRLGRNARYIVRRSPGFISSTLNPLASHSDLNHPASTVIGGKVL